MVKRSLFLWCLVLLLIVNLGNLSAQIGTFKQNECIIVRATLEDTVGKITIYYPNSSVAAFDEDLVDMGDNQLLYVFCGTSELGVYDYYYFNSDTTNYSWDSFEITPTGNKLDIPQTIMYLLIFLSMVGCFIFTFYATLKISYENLRNAEGDVIRINWKKYLKIFCGCVSYVCLVWVVFLSWNLSWAYLQMQGISYFFRYLFYLLVGLAFPLFVLVTVLSVIYFLKDRKLDDYLNKTMRDFR